MRRHLDHFLAATAAAPDGAGLPRFIERELRDFPGCGDLERGFARGALRHLPVRTPRPVLMQGPRDLSQLLRAADGGVLVPRRDGRGCAPLFTGRRPPRALPRLLHATLGLKPLD